MSTPGKQKKLQKTAAEYASQYPIRALVLQAGGALGSYQGGIYQGLSEAGIEPDWTVGISIGAFNAAIIAGNPPEQRVEKLQTFWEHICAQPWLPNIPYELMAPTIRQWPDYIRTLFDSLQTIRTKIEGQRGFFQPFDPYTLCTLSNPPTKVGVYDTTPLKHTLETFVDFDRLNHSGEMRVSIGAVNVATGEFQYFDNTEQVLRIEHIMASGALPPGFPPVEVDGEYYWDGGLVSNTPLTRILTEPTNQGDALIFQVDLWNAAGRPPANLLEIVDRQTDIQYASRNQTVTQAICRAQNFRKILMEVMTLVPTDQRDNEWFQRAEELSSDIRLNLIHLAYQRKPHETNSVLYQFGSHSMYEHWQAGLDDMRETLQHPDWLIRPVHNHAFITHSLHHQETDLNPGLLL